MAERLLDSDKADHDGGELDQMEFDHHRDERHRLMEDLVRANADLPPRTDRSDHGLGHRPLRPTPDVHPRGASKTP